MSDITPLLKPGQKRIERYGAGRFTIGGELYEGSLLLLPQVITWPVQNFSEVTAEALLALLPPDHAYELMLIGTGADFALAPAEFRAAFKARRIGLEVMSTPAACRTYNVLLTEERSVAAALIAV